MVIIKKPNVILDPNTPQQNEGGIGVFPPVQQEQQQTTQPQTTPAYVPRDFPIPASPPTPHDEQSAAMEISIEEWLNKLLEKAIASRASDIHLEPERGQFSIRARVDGLLHTMESLDTQYQEVIISRIKVLAQMDITKHRLPQDGGFEFSSQGRIYNIRVSTYPTVYGETAVLRILDREGSLLALSDLGFNEQQLKVLDKLIHTSYGMILITGPSGSGKTTQMYSMLNVLNKPENNIMTIEDPVEVQVNSIRQAQTNRYQDFNFPTALRAVLRQDPDIVMVGEIRDKETAQISIQAALTGRLIFSTFHTLNVFAVVTRFIEMDIPRSVVAHTLEGIISSRLVRKICTHCKIDHKITDHERLILDGQIPENLKTFEGKGCDKCMNTGYYGRTGIFQVIAFDDDIRTAILDSKSSVEINALIKEKKMGTLMSSALEKAQGGITTLEEVIRVTM